MCVCVCVCVCVYVCVCCRYVWSQRLTTRDETHLMCVAFAVDAASTPYSQMIGKLFNRLWCVADHVNVPRPGQKECRGHW